LGITAHEKLHLQTLLKALYRYVALLIEQSRRAMKGESFRLASILLRWRDGLREEKPTRHIDGGYATMVVALKGDGTVVYGYKNDRELAVPPLSPLLMTGMGRSGERTPHRIPNFKRGEPRLVLLLTFVLLGK